MNLDNEGITEIHEEYVEEEHNAPVMRTQKQPARSLIEQDDGDIDSIFDQLAKEEQIEDEKEASVKTSASEKVLAVDQDLEEEFSKYFNTSVKAPTPQPKPTKSVQFAQPPPQKQVTHVQNSGFTGKIVERQPDSIPQQQPTQESTKKVSKFKQRMQNK
jgi:hypothetical protein